MPLQPPIPRPGYWPPDTLCLADAVEFVAFATNANEPRLTLRRALADEQITAELCCDGGARHPIAASYWAGQESDEAFIKQYPFVPVLMVERYGLGRRLRRQAQRREFGAIVLKKAEIGVTFGAEVDAWTKSQQPKRGPRPTEQLNTATHASRLQSHTTNKAKPGPKTLYEDRLKTMLLQIKQQRADLYQSSPDAIGKEIQRLWKRQGHLTRLPSSRSALRDAVTRIRGEIEMEE